MPRWLPTLALGLFLLPAPPVRAADDVIDAVMYRDPELPMPRVVETFHPRLTELWLETLARPEADLKSRAAMTIAQAHHRGMTGLDVMVDPLARELDRAERHPSVVIAVAKALVTLDARQAAPQLFRVASSGDNDLREIIEPALAHWDHPPARAAWLERINQPPPYRRGTLLAIRGLAAVREEKAAPRLRELVLARDVPPPVRLEAARGLGVIRPTGSEADARQLAADASPVGRTDRQAAAALLRHHAGDEAVRLLQALGRDAEPAVVAGAIARLVEIDPTHVLPVLDTALASPDANVRSLGVDVLFRLPSDGHVRRLADRLADPHPDVRVKAREALRELAARDELRESVFRDGSRVLGGSDWRGLEQAAVLLARLDHKPAAARLADLLPHDRPEVYVTAAWGLRVLAVPETLPAALDYLRARDKSALAGRPGAPPETVDLQLSQLAQFLGQARYRPADAVLRRAVPPRSPLGMETRAAAAWALGLIHEGTPVPELAGVFAGRVRAVMPFDLEDERVRQMSAVALGRMKAAGELETLRAFYRAKQPTLDVVSNACGWAIEQITGEPMPPAGTVEVPQPGGFLTPTSGPPR